MELPCVHGKCVPDNDTGSHCECDPDYRDRLCDMSKTSLYFVIQCAQLFNICICVVSASGSLNG